MPLCALLTGWRRITGWPYARPAVPAPRAVLFLKLTEQGSTVLAYPALRRATERVGRDRVYLLVLERNRDIVDVLDVVPRDNVVTVPDGSLGALATGLWRALARVRRLEVDAVVDLEGFARATALFAYLTGAPIRVGHHAFDGGPYRGDLLTHRLLYSIDLHARQTFESLVAALDAPVAELPALDFTPAPEPWCRAVFTPRDGEREAGRRLLAALAPGRGDAPLALLHPSCDDAIPDRRWPAERWVELAQRLLASHPRAWVGFTGAPSEAGQVAALVRRVGVSRCFSLAGRTTLRELLVVYGLADVLVTSDSGPSHFASLTPIQVVTLFGPETPRLYAAETPRNHVVYAGLACSPSVHAFNGRRSPLPIDLPMRRITTEQVLARVAPLLRG